MKIGILTFHKAKNYGALLQAYALQKKINDNNYEAEIIDYDCPKFKNMYSLFNFKNIRNIKSFFRELVTTYYKFQKYNKFNNFIKKYIKISNRKNINRNGLNELNELYDIFITGSDQVWSNSCADFDKTYFLDFVNNKEKKNSYAASFGMKEIPPLQNEEYKKLLNDFNKISVREERGKEIIEKELNVGNATLVCDPTFLLKKSEWEEIALKNKIKDKYILVYDLYNSKSLINFVKDIAQKYNYKIISLQSRLKKDIEDSIAIRTAGIEEFITLFKNAEIVVTNSFHGTVFSIIFNKKFFVEYLKENEVSNIRLENILSMYRLTDRVIEDGNNNSIESSIDYKNVNDILEREREKSLNFINEMLQK